MAADLTSKFLGAMVGSAVGDAVGQLAFMHPRLEDLLSRLGTAEELRYTDDTAMALGLAESLLSRKGIDQGHLGETFRKNFRLEPWRGYASGPPTLFSMVESSGLSFVEAARSLFGGAGSLGNGAAMRIAPVGLFFSDAPDLYEQACASAEVTHAHPVGMDGAALQAAAVALAVRMDPGEGFHPGPFLDRLTALSRTAEMKAKLERVRGLIREGAPPEAAAAALGRSVAVHESMPFALYAFLRHPHSFDGCLFCAVLNGGDRDTLGAMACAVSGAHLGIEAVPLPWREKLENRWYIERLARALAER